MNLPEELSNQTDFTVHSGLIIFSIPDFGPRKSNLGGEPVLLLVDVEPEGVDAEPELKE